MRDEITDLFNSVRSELGDVGAKIVLADGSEHDVLAPSAGLSRTSSEQGEGESPDAVIRMLYDDYAAAGIKMRDVVTLVDCCAVSTRLRIREIVNTGGIMRLLCEAVNG